MSQQITLNNARCTHYDVVNSQMGVENENHKLYLMFTTHVYSKYKCAIKVNVYW